MINIPTKPGDPVDFKTYQGQENLKKRLLLRMKAMKRGDSMRGLFCATSGQGKTAIVRVLANELAKRNLVDNYYEIVASKFETKNDLDYFIRRVPPYSMIFIDEIHGLPASVRDALYPAIQDNVYPFSADMTARALPVGLHWIGATTDLGKVHPALQRRLMPMFLEPLSLEDRAWLALMLPRKVEEDAAFEMAAKCWSPYEVKDELYATAADVATEQNSWAITLDHVLEACDLLQIDKNGLRQKDRDVLEALYKSEPKKVKGEFLYALSKGALITIVGIDEPTFSSNIEPKLLKLNYLAVRGGVGRYLTNKAIQEYFSNDDKTKNGEEVSSGFTI